MRDRRYYTHRLLESWKDADGKRRKRILLNLGADYPIPKKDWRLLCKILKERMERSSQYQLGNLDPPELVQEAKYLARRLCRKAGTAMGTGTGSGSST